MEKIQWFKSGEKKWLRNFAESRGTALSKIASVIPPLTRNSLLSTGFREWSGFPETID
jgi:hypothetical protein